MDKGGKRNIENEYSSLSNLRRGIKEVNTHTLYLARVDLTLKLHSSFLFKPISFWNLLCVERESPGKFNKYVY